MILKELADPRCAYSCIPGFWLTAISFLSMLNHRQ